MKIQKNKYFFLGGGGSGWVGGSGWGVSGWMGTENSFCENSIFFFFFFLGGGGGGSGRGGGDVGLGGQGGCEQRSKVFVKIQKKKILRGGGVGWGRVGGIDQGLGWGRWRSKVWGRWVMWGMGDVNQE